MFSIDQFTHPASGVAAIRQELTTNTARIDFAARLWPVFRALIAGALDELTALLGGAVAVVMETIELHVQRFFVQALQLDPRTLHLEVK